MCIKIFIHYKNDGYKYLSWTKFNS